MEMEVRAKKASRGASRVTIGTTRDVERPLDREVVDEIVLVGQGIG